MEPILVISSILLWVVLSFNLLLTLALVRRINVLSRTGGMLKPDMLALGKKAPDFVLDTLDGRMVTQADYIGKQLAMVFVSPTCASCKDLMPKLQEIGSKAQRAGVELVAVSLSGAEATQAFIRALDVTASMVMIPRSVDELWSSYKVPGTPSFYFIDEQGKIQAAGFLDENWNQLVEKWHSSFQN